MTDIGPSVSAAQEFARHVLRPHWLNPGTVALVTFSFEGTPFEAQRMWDVSQNSTTEEACHVMIPGPGYTAKT